MSKISKIIYFLFLTFIVFLGASLLLQPPLVQTYSDKDISFIIPSTWDYLDNSFPAVKQAGEENLTPFSDEGSLINFKYPANWLIQQESFSGSEIIKHIQLTSSDKKSVCLVQIWEKYKPLQEFIEDIKIAPFKGSNIQDFSIEKALVNDCSGFLISYKTDDVLCREIYLEKSNRIFRIAYYFHGHVWNEEQESILQTIIESFIIKY